MFLTMRPETAFVLASLRRDAAAPDAQARAARAVTDWPAVVRLARDEDVCWWALRALPAGDAGDRADGARGALAAEVRQTALHALDGARQLTSLCRLLDDAGVRAVAYKGPALSTDVHGDVAARRFDDLDILVAECDRDRAHAALRAAGYASPAGYTRREERFYSRWEGVAHLVRADELPIELHWRCQAPRYGGPQDPAGIVARAVPCAVGGGTVLVPSREDLGVLLALHGVKHAWKTLMWLADFAAVVARPDFDWALATERAATWQVRRAWHYALRVAQLLVSVPVPQALADEARADGRVAPLVEAVVARVNGAAVVPNVGAEASARYDLQWLDGGWGQARYVALAATLPTPQERNAARFPDLLLPLAYPVRAWRLLAHALGRRR